MYGLFFFNGYVPHQIMRQSKQNSCEHVGTSVRSTKACKHMVQCSSSSSVPGSGSGTSSSVSCLGETESEFEMCCGCILTVQYVSVALSTASELGGIIDYLISTAPGRRPSI
jgi:hypothetical protein